jgi:nucleotide-binding universal stress UspA family protein
MKILVPIDGNDGSLSAANKAVEMAKSDGSSVKLLTIVRGKDIRTYRRYARIWQYADGTAFDAASKLMDRNEAVRIKTGEAAGLLDSIASRLEYSEDLVEKAVLAGKSDKELLAAAKEADMIVISRGSGYAAKSFISKLPCTVLIVQ